MIKPGDKAPDFTLKDHNKNDVELSEYAGKKILLSFHPLAWTKICAEQMKSLETNFQEFEMSYTVALGMSIDTVPSKHAWAKALGIEKTRLVSDFWPHGSVAEKYGVLRSEGFSERALFFIDKKGIISAILVMDINRRPDLAACATELEKLNKK